MCQGLFGREEGGFLYQRLPHGTEGPFPLSPSDTVVLEIAPRACIFQAKVYHRTTSPVLLHFC